MLTAQPGGGRDLAFPVPVPQPSCEQPRGHASPHCLHPEAHSSQTPPCGSGKAQVLVLVSGWQVPEL